MPIRSLIPVSCNHFILSDRAHVNLIVPVRVCTGVMKSGLNSTLTFRPLLKLIFDKELNPGPNGSSNCLVKANTRNTNNVKIAHLIFRSPKWQDHFLLVKETILSNKFDVFTITETWVDASVSDLEIEVPGYNIYRVDRSNKTGAGSVHMSWTPIVQN